MAGGWAATRVLGSSVPLSTSGGKLRSGARFGQLQSGTECPPVLAGGASVGGAIVCITGVRALAWLIRFRIIILMFVHLYASGATY